MGEKNSVNSQQDEFTLQVGGNDITQSDKRNESIVEATSTTLEKDMETSKVKTPVKIVKTQSGPLVPGTVLSHSFSERGRAFERYIVFSYYIFTFVLVLGYIFGSFRENHGKALDIREWSGMEWKVIAFIKFE